MIKYRSVFLSDIHLGTKMCQANHLLDFIKSFESEKIYLIGDIIDCWAMNSKKYWPQEHNDVIQKLLRKSRKGTTIIYVPGNHDELMRSYCNAELGNIFLLTQTIHYGIDNKKYLITHGDQFDIVIKNAKWISHIGSWAYDVTIVVNYFINKINHFFGFKNWSLSLFLKHKVKEAVNFIGNYEKTLSNYVKSKNMNGIICGHIHHANISKIDDIVYMNCGDWVESCTALVEHLDGKFEIIKWTEKIDKSDQ